MTKADLYAILGVAPEASLNDGESKARQRSEPECGGGTDSWSTLR